MDSFDRLSMRILEIKVVTNTDITRGGSRLVCGGASVNRSHVILLTNGGGERYVSFYLHKG